MASRLRLHPPTRLPPSTVAGGRGLRLAAAIPALCVVMLLAADAAHALPCTDPGPIATSITNDAAIEVHALRRENAENCAAFLDWSEGVTDRSDLAWWGAWAIVGVLLGVFAGQMLNSAFRFWEGDDG